MRGCSRDSFYRFKELYEKGGELVAQEVSRLKTGVETPQAPEIKAAAVALAMEQQA